jgi:hypothetical protein
VRSPWGICIVAALATVYSLLTIEYSTRTAGQLWSGAFAALLLVGAIGLFLRRSWARFPIYAFSVAVVPTGVPSIGVLWGYGSRAELVEAGANSLCRTPGELAVCLARIEIS